MSEKSHVSLEQRLCIVCGHPYASGVLLHRRLQPVLESKTVTGWGICEEHKKLRDEGFVALVEINNPEDSGSTLSQEAASRTGQIMHMKREIFEEIFDRRVDERGVAFVEPQVVEMIKKFYKRDTGEDLKPREPAEVSADQQVV